MNVVRLVATIFATLLFSGCTTIEYKMVGKFDDHNELILGDLVHDLSVGIAQISATMQNTGIRCHGESRVTYYPSSFGCAGQRGTAELKCEDGRSANANWTAESCTSGYGTGSDSDGIGFSFTFGLSESQAKAALEKMRPSVAQKPDPPIYNPKDLRICNMATTENGANWVSDTSPYRPYKTEASRRGLTLAECLNLISTGRETASKLKVRPKRKVRNYAAVTTLHLPEKLSADGEEVQVSGRVSGNDDIVEIRVLGKSIPLGTDGKFEVTLYVPGNGLEVEVEVVDAWNNRIRKTVSISRTIPTALPTKEFSPLNPTNVAVQVRKDAVALVVGLSEYQDAPTAPFADRDAEYFRDYAHRALGVPKPNIKMLVNEDASRTGLMKVLKLWLPAIATPDQSDVFVFFAGHGLANAVGDKLYFLPYDTDLALLDDTAVLRDEVFASLLNAKPRSVTFFLDTCYSGGTRTEEPLVADARGIRVVTKSTRIPPNFTVLSAAGNDQISSSLPEAKHGLFSYYLMKGLEGNADLNDDRKITMGELYQFVLRNVPRQAVSNGRKQNPQLAGDKNRVLVNF